MSDILEIKRRLADRAQSVAEMLLPQGRKIQNEWRVGSINGEPGESLGVHLSGEKVGVWKDFNGGEGGDLIDLWMVTRGLTLTKVLDEACAYLGIERPKAFRESRRQYTRPAKPRCTVPQNRVRDYLTQDRGIPFEILRRYQIGEDGNKIIFPFILPDGELVLAKAREAIAGADPKPTAANCEPILFGWQAVPGNAREVVLTEGEIDALTMAAFGFAAMSVPFGGGGKGKQNWIENEFDRMQRFEKIYIATDMDKPGDEAAAEIVSRLGRHRCYRVQMPYKDANECWLQGVSPEQMAALIASAQPMDPEGLRRAGAYLDRVTELFYPTKNTQPGYTVPYAGLKGEIMFRPGELTLWSGDTGSGKTQIICDCAPFWIKQGSRICVASLEMKPEQTLRRMVKQTGGVDRPTRSFLESTLAYLDGGLLIYEKVGKANTETLLEIFGYAQAKYGCDQFVIDSLMRLGIASDDYDGQADAVSGMVDWAVEKNAHLHLVAHARKRSHGSGAPETEDVKGAMEVGANAANIIIIWRNRKIEQSEGDPRERPEFTEEPGVKVNIAKQRNGDFEDALKLYFSRRTYQYFSAIDNRKLPRCYVQDDVGTGLLSEVA